MKLMHQLGGFDVWSNLNRWSSVSPAHRVASTWSCSSPACPADWVWDQKYKLKLQDKQLTKAEALPGAARCPLSADGISRQDTGTGCQHSKTKACVTGVLKRAAALLQLTGSVRRRAEITSQRKEYVFF